ncbi:hypothetical protein [Paenibacillus qinlingensis]|uniref:Uncharacterized protein n=1 Tax=Paenibacillus qinlingensis TaxID=1837343 RepID=A0ABU1NXU4_9BACL|nr:hypothetical protein [Paenibacillus qinlingensis]MDR6552290.1 hypothetical protein [Paenibacillus qinlingensis]
MSDVHQQILEELKMIEKEEGVRILYAPLFAHGERELSGIFAG